MKDVNKYKSIIKEGVLIDTLPFDIVSSIATNNTSLGNNPAIPDIFDIPFLAKIVKNKFQDTKEKLIEIGSIDDVKGTDLYSVLAELINRCQEYEKPIRNELEKLCYNYVIELFSVPEELIIFNLELKDSIDMSKNNILLDPFDGEDDIELIDVKNAMSLKYEIHKRKLLNSLCIGAGMDLYKPIINFYESELNNLNPKLIDLYNKILCINDYLLLTKEDLKITEDNKKQMGVVEVQLGNEEYKTTINAQAIIFPVLVIETIKGLMELFISHGLPKNKQEALYVLNKTDFIKAEPWNMRIGPELWKLLTMSFNDINSNEIPYLMKRISRLDVDKFNFLMKEVFAKTRKGKEIMSFICNKAKNDMDYNRFINKMDKMKLNNSLITDEFIHENEL